MTDEVDAYEEASRESVELGNRLADADQEAHLWDIADGLLAGAIQYWLYARQPCDDPSCDECAPVRTSALRLAELQRLVEELATSSEYFHSPNDPDVGRA